MKLIFHLGLSDQLNEVLSQEFYINSTSVTNFGFKKISEC